MWNVEHVPAECEKLSLARRQMAVGSSMIKRLATAEHQRVMAHAAGSLIAASPWIAASFLKVWI